MASKLVAFRLPEDLIQAIEAEAEATGKDKTAVVVSGLRQIFNLPTPDPTLAAVESINECVAKLERRIDSLSEEVKEVMQDFKSSQTSSSHR